MFVYIDRIVRFITVMVYFILDNRFAYICFVFYCLSTTDRLIFVAIVMCTWNFFVYIFYAIWGMARLEINLWRSWQAAISLGEEHASFEPGIAEWDSYHIYLWWSPLGIGNLLNWNILVGSGRENNCDAVSNVERKRLLDKLNPLGKSLGRCGVVSADF